MRARPLIAFGFSLLLLPQLALAQWRLAGEPISTAANTQTAPSIVSDGAGGVFITWHDLRSGTNYDIYAQRVNAAGVPQWPTDGVALCIATGDQFATAIASDGAGGAIITWNDFRSGADYDIYAQRVNAAGVPQWPANGVALSAATNSQRDPMIVLDGAGGAIVTWRDIRSGTDYDIYAQRVNAAGAPQWTANGVALCSIAGADQVSPMIVADGAGGAIVTWQDYRFAVSDVYAQRVTIAGVPLWTPNGVALCSAANGQHNPMIASDGAGGAIVTWYDLRNATIDVYAQRVSIAGAPQWASNGVAICTVANDQSDPMIVSDGAGGAVITWHDLRNGADSDIYAQRVNATGVPQWTANGVALCTATNYQSYPSIVSDGTGGTIVTWVDFRSGAHYDIYTQRMDLAGAPQWTANGVALCTSANQQDDLTVTSDGAGGTVVAWRDNRSGAYDIYAQRIDNRYGYWGRPEPTIASAGDNPSDQGRKVILRWDASGRDRYYDPAISQYTLWRATDFAAASALREIDPTRVVGDPRGIKRDLIGSTIWEKSTANGPEYWERIETQEATYQATYSSLAETRQDSVAGDAALHYFKVLAHESTSPQGRIWESGVVSAYSVDNLAPAAPLLLTAQRVGADVQLEWNRAVAADLRDYSIYRATSSGVTPVPLNFLANSEDTVAVDAGAPVTVLYYIVTAFDVHENQSGASNEASVGAVTNVGNTPSITALTVLDNVPNPFASTTTLRIGLPRASEVEIDVFDVAGRRVRSERASLVSAGWREIAFDARANGGQALPSGVYFYRVKAAGETITRKMVITR